MTFKEISGYLHGRYDLGVRMLEENADGAKRVVLRRYRCSNPAFEATCQDAFSEYRVRNIFTRADMEGTYDCPLVCIIDPLIHLTEGDAEEVKEDEI